MSAAAALLALALTAGAMHPSQCPYWAEAVREIATMQPSAREALPRVAADLRRHGRLSESDYRRLLRALAFVRAHGTDEAYTAALAVCPGRGA